MQLDHILRKIVGGAHQVLAQGVSDPPVRTGRTAETEIDAAREQRVKCAELLGDDQRVVIGQHDPARADPDCRCRVADMGEHHRHRRTGKPVSSVMLRRPEALGARSLGRFCKIGGLGQGLDAAG